MRNQQNRNQSKGDTHDQSGHKNSSQYLRLTVITGITSRCASQIRFLAEFLRSRMRLPRNHIKIVAAFNNPISLISYVILTKRGDIHLLLFVQDLEITLFQSGDSATIVISYRNIERDQIRVNNYTPTIESLATSLVSGVILCNSRKRKRE